MCCEAYEEFVYYSTTFSRTETEILKQSISDSVIQENIIGLSPERQEILLSKLGIS